MLFCVFVFDDCLFTYTHTHHTDDKSKSDNTDYNNSNYCGSMNKLGSKSVML